MPPPLPWRIRTRPERLILLFVASAASLASILLFAHSVHFAFFGCVWKCATGIPCAGCGGTRAMMALIGGSPLDALAWNPGAVLAFALVSAAGIYAASVLALHMNPWRPAFVRSGSWKFAFLAGMAANWIYLLCAGRV
jgi:hypothetical protein